MTQQTAQVLIALIGCVFFLVAIYSLTRRQRLTFRYAMGWLTLGILGILSISLIPFASHIAKVLHVSPAAVVAVSAVALVLAICVQLSISISGMQQQIRRLAEEIALLHEGREKK
jgi:hypothetical protein